MLCAVYVDNEDVVFAEIIQVFKVLEVSYYYCIDLSAIDMTQIVTIILMQLVIKLFILSDYIKMNVYYRI